MDHHDIGIVQSSFARVFAAKGQISGRFYQQLFELRPQYRQLFEHDMHSQKEMFAGMLAQSVRALNNYPDYPDAMLRIAQKHGDLGLREADFALAEQAMNVALKASALSPPELEAWSKTVRWLISGFVSACVKAA